MKAIISHDVDHITVFEHKNMILPKHLFRNCIETVAGHVSVTEFISRLIIILKNKWNNIEALMEYNKKNNIPATFFFGVNNGLGLDYSVDLVKPWIMKVKNEGFDVGVHGIHFSDSEKIADEYHVFKNTSDMDEFGIRMHYLRMTDSTVNYLSDTGYIFDSSINKMENPYKVGTLWEFPLHIMDGHVLYNNSRWQNQDLQQAIDTTKTRIDEAKNKEIKYLTVLFHDRYFHTSFKTWKDWYLWLIGYLSECNIEFVSYKEAIKELEIQTV